MAYYNEIDPFCCEVLKARVADGRLPEGQVDGRDVREVRPEEIPQGQVHLFAGIGGFAYAARLAGLPDDFDIWTAGFPCQDISTAGKGAGLRGSRSGLFFEIARLLHGVKRRPAWVLLENVPALRTRGADRVLDEMAGVGYFCWPLVVGAWAVGAPHKRNRVWIVCRSMDNATAPRWAGSARCESSRAIRDEARGAESTRPCSPRLAQPSGTGTGGEPRTVDGGPRASGLRQGNGAAGTVRVDAAGADRVADAKKQREREQDDAARAEPQEGNARKVLGGGSPPRSNELADAASQFTSRMESGGSGRGQPKSAPRNAGGHCWPSRPGQPQHEWEAARLLELPLGGLVDGIPAKLVRLANRSALKAYGNSIVPQVAAEIMRAMTGGPLLAQAEET